MKCSAFKSFLILISLAIANIANGQFPSDTTNETEPGVVPYILPDPLMTFNGERIKTKNEWLKFQRPFIYHLFEENVYGRYPSEPVSISYRLREKSENALGGKAIRKQVRIYLNPSDTSVYTDVLVYLPKNKTGPVPVFLGLNFGGNAAVQTEDEIFISDLPIRPDFNRRLSPSERGKYASRWPVNMIIESGFGVVTAYYGDFELDKKDGWKTGVRSKMQNELNIKPDEWGAVGTWAWGLSRIMDYLEKDGDVNSDKVAVMGLSRLGKTALWAGASDTRFSLVISNESGETGAALARRWFGETVKRINTSFPHWFSGKYKTYNDDVFSLPVDQHELLCLIAPRPLYIASAEEDLWSDPQGEFLSAWHAGQVYSLFGKEGLGTSVMPPVNHPVGKYIRYHIRTGKHDITAYDWKQYLKFARDFWND